MGAFPDGNLDGDPHHGGLAAPVRAHHRIARIDGLVRLTVASIAVTGDAVARAGLSDLMRVLRDGAAAEISVTA